MSLCLFVSDLHGRIDRYEKLRGVIRRERPAGVFVGGDLMAGGLADLMEGGCGEDFVGAWLRPALAGLKEELGEDYPSVFLIPGNDDPRIIECELQELEGEGLLHYVHGRRVTFGDHIVYGYACIPPSPFQLKDWERYDVARHVDPGCVAPTEGWLTVPQEESSLKFGTIAQDLGELVGDDVLDGAIFLFHVPPYQTNLDRAALDHIMIDHVAVDVHIGSIAVRRFIEARQPLVTLHGHVHESSRLTGAWMDRIGRTVCLSAAWDGPELAVVRFDPARQDEATRELL